MKEKEKIPEIVVKLNDKDYQTNWQEEVKIARETIDENMMEQASLYGWYGVLSSMLDEEVGNKKLELSVLEAQLYDKYRNRAVRIGEKVTDKRIDSLVKQDEDYIAEALEVNRVKKEHGIFNAIVKSFEHRREMLTNLGHKIRKEMEGEIIVKNP